MENEDSISNMQVMCRFRPLSAKEAQNSKKSYISIEDSKSIVVQPSKEKSEPLLFSFNWVFPPETDQETAYEISARPIVDSVMQGFNGCVLAYGQTSSGKTYTMMGDDIYDLKAMGTIPRMVSTVFQHIERADEHIEFTVKVSYLEIYMEKIQDLLNDSKANLSMHENKVKGFYIEDLTEEYVACEEDVFEIMEVGNKNREVGYTHMNAKSSRSHVIFVMTITQENKLDYTAKTSKLYMVDLAGSEKVSKTGAQGKRLEEAKNINKSLTTLGIVINALTEGKTSHIPYRDSKLTRVLQDSLGGNSKTCLIVTCSTSQYNEQETISTLRFGVRARAIKNKPKVNKEYTLAELKLLLAQAREEIAKRDARIRILEQALKSAGVPIPTAAALPRGEDSQRDSQENSQEGLESTLRAEYQEVFQELEQTREKLSKDVEELTRLKQTYAQNELELEMTKSQNEVLEQENSELKKKLQDLEDQQKEKEDMVECLNEAKTNLEQEMQSINQKRLEIEQKLNEREVELQQLQIEINLKSQENYQISHNQFNHITEELNQEKEINTQYQNDIKALQRQLDEALSGTHPEINRIKEMAKDQIAREERDKWNQEKKEILKALQKKAESFVALEIELSQARNNYKKLKNFLSEGETALFKKTTVLEKNLEQLSLMYHQIVTQKSSLKIENSVNSKKIQRLQHKNKTLEEEARELREKLKDLNEQINLLSADMQLMQANPPKMSFVTHSKVRKTIKGGGGKMALLNTLRTNSELFTTFAKNFGKNI